MAIVIAGGLVFATILTLMLTPACLMLAAKFSERNKARREQRTAKGKPADLQST